MTQDWLADIFRAALAPAQSGFGPAVGLPSAWATPRLDAASLVLNRATPATAFAGLGGARSLRGPATGYSLNLSPQAQALYGGKPKKTAAAPTSSQPVGQPEPADPSQLGPGVSANVMRWAPLAQKYAAENGIPVEAVLAIIQNESGGDPRAQSVNNPGYGTAKGLMQTLDLHYQPGEDAYDPETNIRAGARYLGGIARRRGGDMDKLMAEYMGGGGAFDQAGNIRRDVRDANISIGDYIDRKWRPALSAYQAQMQRQKNVGVVAPAAEPATQAAADQAPNDYAHAALTRAATRIGDPYVFGGAREGAFDCSGLVQWAYQQAGVSMPRTAQQQYDATRRLPPDQVRPGDLVFYRGTYDAGTPVTHVGIVAGNGMILMAPSEGDKVKLVSANNPYWVQHLYGYGRVGG